MFQKDSHRHHDEHLEQIVHGIGRIVRHLEEVTSAVYSESSRIIETLERLSVPDEYNTLGAQLASVHGRSTTMSPINIPVPKLLDIEKVLLSVMPRKADGKVDIGAVVTWVSSAPDQVGIEPGTEPFVFNDGDNGDVTCPGNFNCFALTPLDTGAADVTVSAPGYDPAIFAISYAPGQPRSLTASYGQPVSDL